MKRIFLSLFFIGGLATAALAQSAQYQEVMTKQVGELDSVSTFTLDNMQQKANTFERIAEAEKTQWLPYYYAAYCEVMTAFMQKDNSLKDPLANKAETNLDMAEALSPNNSEIACIRSLVATVRLIVDPMNRGQKYGMESAKQLEQAKTYNPENPRTYLLKGESLYSTPEAFGGSKEKAKVMFERALEKFTAFKPESNIAPHWGEPRVRMFLSQYK